jgi:Holin of 3TMs, for gene-transfer release
MPIMDVVAGAFSGIVKPVLDKFIPDAKDRLEAENMIMKGAMALDMAQIEVNKTEAANPNIFVSGWRPFIGWVCGVSFGYSVIGYTFLNWVLAVYATYVGHPIPLLPQPDTTMTMELLLAMLGLGGMRTYEKLKGLTR